MLVRKRSVFASIVLAMCISGLALPANAANPTINVSGSTQYKPDERRTATISGRLTNPTKSRAVYLQRRAAGVGNFAKVATSKTGKNGAYSFKVAVPSTTVSYDYRVWGAYKKGKYAAQYVPNSNPGKRIAFTNRWSLKFDDDFGSFDSTKWGYRQSGTRLAPSRTRSMSHPRAADVKSGTMQVRVHNATSGHKKLDDYTQNEWANHPSPRYINGHVSTENKFSFTYGIAAARIKFAKTRGQHGSFWLQPIAGTSGDEIDIVEFFGNGYSKSGIKGGLAHFIHSPAKGKIGGMVDSRKMLGKGTPYSGYHVYSVDWTPQRYVFRVDGFVVKTLNRATSNVPHFLILSQLTSDWELAEKDKKSDLKKAFKNEVDNGGSKTYVDWVRVWQVPSMS